MNFISLSQKDIDLILAIQKDNFADGWNREQLLLGFNEGNLFAFGIEENQAVVGLITYSLAIDTADIEGVVTISSERKKGYGKMLVEYLLNQLLAQGINKVFLEVRESNIPAINLYKACGFKQISVRKKYYSDGENGLVLLREL